MKKNIQIILTTIVMLSVVFVSCKKAANNSPFDYLTESSVHADDQARFSNEMDDIANDANVISQENTAFNGRIENVLGAVCNATTVLDSTSTLRRITVTYNGPNCAGTRSRTGTVLLTMPLGQRWKTPGAVLTMDIQNLVITRLSDNKSITINGTKTITNVTGGRLSDLSTLGTITHRIATTGSGITVTFDNGTQRIWQEAKQRTFTYSGGIVITTTGYHTDGTTSNISEWGTTRNGNTFVTAITQPKVIRQDCNFRLVSGQVTHSKLSTNVVVTFGLDASGNAAACPGLGFYYYKAVWTSANGSVRTIIRPY